MTLVQISDLCWGQNATSLNKKQFFSALKLVAAHQANIPITSDIISTSLELPLPRFSWNNIDEPQIGDLIELTSDATDYIEPVDSTDSEVDSDTLSIVRNGSPEISSTASDSPTPTNSVQDRSWAVGAWQGLVSEEQRQLLEESSDRHSSDEDTEVSSEIWTINSEQREYYTNQFRSLQPDTNALLAGPVARMFFEKSRLPVHELRKIWQLADVTKDGALSLHEFNTAMHLVVLRRNHIELPDVLPPTLLPGGNDTPLSVSPEPVLVTTEPMLSPQTKDTKEWTKFIDSPTSSVSSPGPKPVNFDFQKITIEDSKILHPVPLRVTPECPPPPPTEDLVDSQEAPSPKKFIEGANNNNSAIQRPQPKKISIPGPGAIPPPPGGQNSVDEGPVSLPAFPPPKKEKPPPPPPRPFKSHGRSSSLDLNRLKMGAPPSVPPRISPNIQSGKKLVNQRSEGAEGAFANFDDEFEKYENVDDEGVFPGDVYEAERKKIFAKFTGNSELPRKHGAFEVYRKPVKSQDGAISVDDKVKWEQFQKLQEENTVLLRICQELSQELADIREEKMTLKLKLEKQKKNSNSLA